MRNLWIAWVAVSLILSVLVIWVAAHFIIKYW